MSPTPGVGVRSVLRASLRPTIAVFSASSLICLCGGVILFATAGNAPAQESSSTDLRTSLTALGLIFAAVLCERLAVSLAFAHSERRRGQLTSLLFALFCLLMMLDSLFFTLRVRSALNVPWTLAGLPIEEALPPLEVTVFAPLALLYAVWPILRRALHVRQSATYTSGAAVSARDALQSPQSYAPARAPQQAAT